MFNVDNASLSAHHSSSTFEFLRGWRGAVCFETVNISSVNLCQVQPYVVYLILPNPFSFLSQLLLMHYIIFLDPWLASVSHRAVSDSSVKTL